MVCEEESRRGGWNLSAKPCDSCKSSSALLFCRADSAFLCINCDSKIHTANKLASRHERVWMCEVCEQAPASVTCKADAAALCVTCDRDIHSANPLARRHERFPVVPFYESVSVKSNTAAAAAVNFLVPDASDVVDGGGGGGGFMKPTTTTEDQDQDRDQDQDQEGAAYEEAEEDEDDETREEEAEAASWLLQNPNPKLMEAPDLKTGDYFFTDVDPFLDLDYSTPPINGARFHPNHHHHHHHGSGGTDSVVPVQNEHHLHLPPLIPSSQTCIEFDFTRSKPNYNYNNTSPLSQSVSSCSLEVGVVPEANCDVSNSFMINNIKNGIEHLNGLNSSIGVNNNQGVVVVAAAACQLSGLDREARVLRYREKRKNRKFEKTIRYASRKAYAETRPRIKGRFAKRTEIESEVDRIYSSAAALMVDSGYGIVPSF